jgi:glyoxylase-like metal-dependent hydrolase (beta-lactamase superfamily II)
MITEVDSGLYRLEAPLGDRIVCCYLLRGSEYALLVDSGVSTTPAEVLVPALTEMGIDLGDIGYVVSTHADVDHVGGNAPLREIAPHARFICHRADKRIIEDIELMISDRYGEFERDHGIVDPPAVTEWVRANGSTGPIDIAVIGGETISLGGDYDVQLLHTPGHSRGHLTVYRWQTSTAIISDAVLWQGVVATDGTVALPPTYRYVNSYEQTIQLLECLGPELLLTGHYPVFRGEGVATFLSESKLFAATLEQTLRDELARSATPRTTRDLLSTLGPQLGSWSVDANDAFVFPLLGHLERLAETRLVSVGREEGLTTWRWTH